MKKYIYIFILFPLFFACEKEANIDIPNSKPELVTACFVGANEDSIRLKLSWSSPIYYSSQTNLEDEGNASVVLSKGNTTYTMKWDSTTSTYIATNTLFKKGDEVKLEIAYQSDKITSSCVIPSKPQFDMEYKGIIEVLQEDYVENQIVYKFTNNNTDANNFYRILFLGYYHSVQSNTTYSQNMYVKEGELFSFAAGESSDLHLYYGNYEGSDEIDSIKYYIIRCSSDYYKYHSSVYNYVGDDFFVEPSIIFNNVEGGLGIFSSYNMITDTTIIK
jgi:hypothetical protein